MFAGERLDSEALRPVQDGERDEPRIAERWYERSSDVIPPPRSAVGEPVDQKSRQVDEHASRRQTEGQRRSAELAQLDPNPLGDGSVVGHRTHQLPEAGEHFILAHAKWD